MFRGGSSYGEDGMDYGKIETQSLDLLKFTYEELESFHRFDDNEKWNEIITNSASKEMKKTKTWKKIYLNSLMSLFQIWNI